MTDDLIDFKLIEEKIKEQWRLGELSHHGIHHWHQVEWNGLFLSKKTKADQTVIRLFALFHDACRLNDGYDPGHGNRGAELARKFWGKFYQLDHERFELLYHACCNHTHEHSGENSTINTCYDADRLDLGRVGFVLDPNRFATPYGKEIARNSKEILPYQMREWLLTQKNA